MRYNVDISPDFISSVTNRVQADVREWQNRPLERVYPIVYFDALVVKIRDSGHVVNKSVYLAIGVNTEGYRDVLGMWIDKSEGAKFWLKVVTDIQNRGVEDIFIACVDGLKGLPEAIESVYPQVEVQLCIVHMVRNSLKYVSYKDRKAVARDLKDIYNATTEEAAKSALNSFKESWDRQYPSISESLNDNWARVSVIFNYSYTIRKVIYTTNSIESLNNSIRKTIKNKRVFPDDMAALKLIYLSLKKKIEKWVMPIRNWTTVINQFSIIFKDRF